MANGPSLIDSLVDELPGGEFIKKSLGFFTGQQSGSNVKALEAAGAAGLVDKFLGDSLGGSARGAAIAGGMEKLNMGLMDSVMTGIAVERLDQNPFLAKAALGYVALTNIGSHPLVASALIETIAAKTFHNHPILAIGEMMIGAAVGIYGALHAMHGKPEAAPTLAPNPA